MQTKKVRKANRLLPADCQTLDPEQPACYASTGLGQPVTIGPAAGDERNSWNELYYDRKELFGRSWRRGNKQSWSVKDKKRVQYQIGKRVEQRARSLAALEAENEDDDDF